MHQDYQQPPTFEGRIQDFAIVVATHTILHSGYSKLARAVAAEWKRSTSEVQYCLTYLSDDVPLIHLIEAWRDVVTNPTLIKNDKKLSPRKAHICHYIKANQTLFNMPNVFYCSRSCQTEDWRILHRLECAPFDNIKGSFPASYRAQLGLHMENICNIQSGTFGPTLKNDHPRENFCSDYVDSPGTVHYAQRLRIYTYLDEFETHSDRVKLVHGLFVYGVDIVGVLARFHYSPDASPNSS
ncbi:hypothetical protein D9611_015157 [Ephemerocybe angulata]|uniref:MYND-type domain-containing protein n=1 Tax=Ephemerocybe angulata TaxID=980116 RepID=A0A8H5EQN0_9AGAR|nr:hypothetical protein D9611_015157 [Tulosesus angulatus]